MTHTALLDNVTVTTNTAGDYTNYYNVASVTNSSQDITLDE